MTFDEFMAESVIEELEQNDKFEEEQTDNDKNLGDLSETFIDPRSDPEDSVQLINFCSNINVQKF